MNSNDAPTSTPRAKPDDATLRRSVDASDSLRIVTVLCSGPAAELAERSELKGAEAVIAARALTAAYLMATVGKNEEERLRIQLRGGGSVGTVIADVHGDGRGRAALQAKLPEAMQPASGERRPSVSPWVGVDGMLTVTRDLGLRQPYQGSVDLVSGELDEDLEAYLNESEQLPSTLRCGVWLDDEGEVLAACGVLVQTFPGADPVRVEAARERLFARPLESLTAQALSHEALLERVTSESGFRTVHEHPLRFECPCGPENARRVVSTLGAVDLEALADEQETTEVRCNFCGRVTELAAEDLRDVARKIRAAQAAASEPLH